MRWAWRTLICRTRQKSCGKSSTRSSGQFIAPKGENSMSVPAAFDYHRATTVDEAIALLQQYGDEAKVLAGGHSLLPTMKLRLAQPTHLVDIGRISALSYIREDNGAVAVGAMTTYATIARSDVLRQHFALLPEAAAVLGDPQVRNRGTLGGAVSHADPAADMTAIVMALKADIVVRGPN